MAKKKSSLTKAYEVLDEAKRERQSKRSFKVMLNVPPGCSLESIEEYIQDAVSSMVGCKDPEDPISGLDRNSISVRAMSTVRVPDIEEVVTTILKDLSLSTKIERPRYEMDGYVTIKLNYKEETISETSISGSDLVNSAGIK